MSIHTHSLRVRYIDSDQMGVAHHSAWVAWVEDARIEWLRAHGFSYRALEAQGLLMPVIELHIRYRQSARFDDELSLLTTATIKPPTRVVFTTTVQRDGQTLGVATVTVAAIDRHGRPQRLPAELCAVAPAAAAPKEPSHAR